MNNASWIFFFILLAPTFVFAEYRVYQYFVTPISTYIEAAESYLALSSLDPVSYYAYNGGRKSIKVELLRTWMCPGHTGGGKYYCKSPYKEKVDLAKAREAGKAKGGPQ